MLVIHNGIQFRLRKGVYRGPQFLSFLPHEPCLHMDVEQEVVEFCII